MPEKVTELAILNCLQTKLEFQTFGRCNCHCSCRNLTLSTATCRFILIIHRNARLVCGVICLENTLAHSYFGHNVKHSSYFLHQLVSASVEIITVHMEINNHNYLVSLKKKKNKKLHTHTLCPSPCSNTSKSDHTIRLRHYDCLPTMI